MGKLNLNCLRIQSHKSLFVNSPFVSVSACFVASSCSALSGTVFRAGDGHCLDFAFDARLLAFPWSHKQHDCKSGTHTPHVPPPPPPPLPQTHTTSNSFTHSHTHASAMKSKETGCWRYLHSWILMANSRWCWSRRPILFFRCLQLVFLWHGGVGHSLWPVFADCCVEPLPFYTWVDKEESSLPRSIAESTKSFYLSCTDLALVWNSERNSMEGSRWLSRLPRTLTGSRFYWTSNQSPGLSHVIYRAVIWPMKIFSPFIFCYAFWFTYLCRANKVVLF